MGNMLAKIEKLNVKIKRAETHLIANRDVNKGKCMPREQVALFVHFECHKEINVWTKITLSTVTINFLC